MLYSTFITKAKELTISETEGIWYLEPEWVDIMHRNGLGDLEDLTDCYITDWLDVEDILKLEVKRRNINPKKQAVIDWLYETITATVEPAILQEENSYINNVLQLIKANHTLLQETGEPTDIA